MTRHANTFNAHLTAPKVNGLEARHDILMVTVLCPAPLTRCQRVSVTV